MLDLKTPIDRIFRMTLELHTEVTNLVEGEWVAPSATNGNLFVRATSANAAVDPITTKAMSAFQVWLGQNRPDAYSSSIIGSGTTVTPFGKYIAETDIFDHTKSYAAGTPLTIASVGSQAVLTPADVTAGDIVFANCLAAPTSVVAATAKIKIAVL